MLTLKKRHPKGFSGSGEQAPVGNKQTENLSKGKSLSIKQDLLSYLHM